MLARERVFKTLVHQEPDIVPWGEHYIDYNYDLCRGCTYICPQQILHNTPPLGDMIFLVAYLTVLNKLRKR